jgi:hypothetical protein
LAVVLELVAKSSSGQARDLALHVSRLSIKVRDYMTIPCEKSFHQFCDP